MSAQRLRIVQDGLAERGLDALVVSATTNVAYLVGFTGSNGALLIRPDEATLYTDSRYREQALDEPSVHLGAGVLQTEIGSGAAITQIRDSVPDCESKIGLEADHVSWSQATAFQQASAHIGYVSTVGYVESQRERKDATEIDAMQRAAGVSDSALAETVKGGLVGRSEREIASALDRTVLEHGGHDVAFETIVASGPHSARPHHRPTSRIVQDGDLVVIDSGTMVDGYRSDMTRSFSMGAPDDQKRLMLEAVQEAQTAGVALAAPGVAVREIDRACRSVLSVHGLGEAFVHGTGHGVGLDIHEAPWVNAKSSDVLEVGHVITIEPGVYLEGIGGVRWEDTFVITEKGARALTRAPKEPYL